MLGPLNLFTISDLSVERVLSVAPHRIGDALLRHQPGLVHVVAVDLLNVRHAPG